MATAVYKGYLIVSRVSGCWSVTVDISDQTGSGHSAVHRTIQFETREEVERWGIEQARKWIDRNVSQYECLTEEEAK
jgi:uncharacterized protein DUF6566